MLVAGGEMTRNKRALCVSMLVVGGLALLALRSRSEARTTKAEVVTITCPKTIDVTVGFAAKGGFAATSEPLSLSSPQLIDDARGMLCAYQFNAQGIGILHPLPKGMSCAYVGNRVECKAPLKP
jgi:hypothetical protein